MSKVHFPRAGGNQWVQSFYNFDGGPSATSGDVFFVGSGVTGASDTAGYGRSPEAPFATISYAVATAATANNWDTIYVLPGHTETCTGAGTVTCSKATVTIKGLGNGRKRPIVNYTTAVGASFDITAANVTVDNIVFKPIGVDNVTAAVNISAADCTIQNCEFEHGDATNQAALCILTTNAADRLVIANNFFHGTTDAGTSAAVSLVGGNEIRITNNIMTGAYAQTGGVIKNATTDSLNLHIVGNIIQNFTAGATKVIVLTATSTGFITNNRVAILSGTAPFTGAAMMWNGNYYSNTVATLGVLL